ncbi:hypothetical protein PIB30_103795 [Stylosanthes scabra]|uniref:Uncharacterized protein n=1 Tax=Stylosanthes scabra TaxID=79078 RepID=A0ABU6VX97_9FABA|nr:hypothetical protein [Stylosanthes scabra]
MHTHHQRMPPLPRLSPWRGRRVLERIRLLILGRKGGSGRFWRLPLKRAALDAGLTNGPIRDILGPLVPEQLLRTAQFLACQLTASFQVCVENTFAAKVRLEKELAATKDQAKVQAAELESCRSALTRERKEVESLSQSLKGNQTTLDEAEAATAHWHGEWRSLAEETGSRNLASFDGAEFVGAFSESFDHPVGAFLVCS